MLGRIGEIFMMRSKVIEVLRLINEREKFLDDFHQLLQQQKKQDDEDIPMIEVARELKKLTEKVCREILNFIGDYGTKYGLGKEFRYQGKVSMSDFIEERYICI